MVEPHAVMYTETLKARPIFTASWSVMSVVLVLVSALFVVHNDASTGLLILLFAMPLFMWPAVKYARDRIVVEIASDGVYVETTLPRTNKLKLFGWDQVNSCLVKYGARYWRLGFLKKRSPEDWVYARYIGYCVRPDFLLPVGYRPMFGDKEVVFDVTVHGAPNKVILNTGSLSEFVSAVEQAASAYLKRDFRVEMEKKPSFWQTFSDSPPTSGPIVDREL